MQRTPNASPKYSELVGISCASGHACIAVGQSAEALAERWNGSKWTIQRIPTPKGVTDSELTGVSCVSGRLCVAVGWYQLDPSTKLALVERWNGRRWRRERTPATRKPGGILIGVSCASANSCTAVGNYDAATRVLSLAERWNGHKWQIQQTPNRSGENVLLAISCASRSACIAVGEQESRATGAAPVALAERWNGRKWTTEHTPDPSGATWSQLVGVSCTSAHVCTAVGNSQPDSYSKQHNSYPASTLAERWNGSTWTIQTTPNTSQTNNQLNGVSCASANTCTAVGQSFDNPFTDPEAILAERWNGNRWTIQPTPQPPGSNNSVRFLLGVSCPTSHECLAIGVRHKAPGLVGDDQTLAEHWTG